MESKVLHGDNQVESRRKFVSFLTEGKQKGFEIKQVDGRTVTKAQFLTLSRSQSLLGASLLLACENLFSDNKKGVEIASEAAKNKDAVFIFWEGKKLPANQVKRLEKLFPVHEFKIPASTFRFLESLGKSHSKKAVLDLLHMSLKNSEPEFIFTMLARQIRLLLWAKLDPDTLDVPSWQKEKFVAQAKNFSVENLVGLHAKLLDIDRQNKLSRLPEGLEASLELLAMEL
jgi:DNA polymerase III delta subunit